MRHSRNWPLALCKMVTVSPTATFAAREIKAPCAFTTRVRVSSVKFPAEVFPETEIGTLRRMRMLRRRGGAAIHVFLRGGAIAWRFISNRLAPRTVPDNGTTLPVTFCEDLNHWAGAAAGPAYRRRFRSATPASERQISSGRLYRLAASRCAWHCEYPPPTWNSSRWHRSRTWCDRWRSARSRSQPDFQA